MADKPENPGAAIDHSRFAYARVSTRGQTLEAQLSALAEARIPSGNVFAEKKSGKAGSPRPQWDEVRSRLRPGDTLVVTKLDRMGRDMRETMETAWSLQDLAAKLEILSGPLAGVYSPHGMRRTLNKRVTRSKRACFPWSDGLDRHRF